MTDKTYLRIYFQWVVLELLKVSKCAVLAVDRWSLTAFRRPQYTCQVLGQGFRSLSVQLSPATYNYVHASCNNTFGVAIVTKLYTHLDWGGSIYGPFRSFYNISKTNTAITAKISEPLVQEVRLLLYRVPKSGLFLSISETLRQAEHVYLFLKR